MEAVLEHMNCNLKSRKVARVPMLFLNPEKPFKLRSLKTMFKRLSLTIKRNLMQEKVPFFKTGFLACRAMKKGSDLSTRLGRLRRKFPPGIRFNALLRRNTLALQKLDMKKKCLPFPSTMRIQQKTDEKTGGIQRFAFKCSADKMR